MAYQNVLIGCSLWFFMRQTKLGFWFFSAC